MKIELGESPCKSTHELIANLLESIGPNELSHTLGLMLESYIINSPQDKIDIANTASIVNRLNCFFFNLMHLQKKYNGQQQSNAVLSDETEKCTLN